MEIYGSELLNQKHRIKKSIELSSSILIVLSMLCFTEIDLLCFYSDLGQI